MKKNKPKYHQIVDAAVVAIAENGFHQTQVSKIAKQAGVADGTIYLYFTNKEDLLLSVFREKIGKFTAEMAESMKEQLSAADRLKRLVFLHLAFLAEDPPLAAVIQLERHQSNRDLRQKINEVLNSYFSLIEKILQQGIDSGEFHRALNIRMARQMVFGTLDETMTEWVMNGQASDLTRAAGEVSRMLIQGFSGAAEN